MKLGIYSLKKTLFEGEVREVNCRTKVGEITILDHHEPLISIIEKGVIKIVDKNEKEVYINASSGFLEVRSTNEAKLLVEENTANG